eukprot:CAMPEP_0180149932 /NCGR_PEP_ID=MMETSP0986-20121125/21124_1 /TAXON_ID=697907 /ORGANISM="non described non described, Strain CCMP2293" /LENGTH=76 /DNA_ID=CAMNT_0022096723 /DNA_START=77 /DNA_END=307 /DNA_ORIENTATION=-
MDQKMTPDLADKRIVRRQGPNYLLLSCLIWGPILPLTRLVFRANPPLRDKAFGVALLCAFGHGAHVIYNNNTWIMR